MTKKILLVDDSLFMRKWLINLLADNHFTDVIEAEDGEEAVEKYGAHSPDVVLMDITMEKMNGIEALKLIMEQDPNANIIMCSALGQQSLIIEALRLGAKDFIVKPFFDNISTIIHGLE